MSRLGRFVKKFELSPTIMFYTLELIERKSFEYKIVDDLEQISFLLNILQKEQVSLSVRLSRNIWCSYYSLLSPSSVWSEWSSSRTKKIEFESSSEYSQGPVYDTQPPSWTSKEHQTTPIKVRQGHKTLPEAQRTQGIESITQIIPHGK